MESSVNPQPQNPAPPQTAIAPKPGMFTGRLGRMGYFSAIAYLFAYFLLLVGLQLIFRGSGPVALINFLTIILGLLGILLVIPASISVGVRRWHDLDQSGFFVLLGLIPVVGFIALIILLFIPGTNGPNKFGAPDTAPNTPRKVLLGK